jgi:hypothetical protein
MEETMKDRRYRTSLVVATFLAFTVAAVPGAFARKGCSNASVKGSYGFRFNGTILGGPFAGPATLVGIAKFDGAGNWTRTEIANVNGHPLPSETVTGTYSINEDCTGSTSDEQRHSSFLVLVSNGKEILSEGTKEQIYGFNCYDHVEEAI